jgi:uncharacterized protein (TIGR02246 family)
MTLACAGSASGQTATHQHLGAVHFETSCNAAAQRHVDEGMRYQHSFWYRAAQASFEEALRADPRCAIAYWGIAQSLLANPFNATPPKNLVEGRAAVDKARQLGPRTPREDDLVAAIAVFYTNVDTLDQWTRTQAYARTMQGVATRYPKDDEVQIYYALALDMSASPADKTYVNQLQAAAILEPIFARQPNHPGVAHYLIHTYDSPALAARGLDAAVRYAGIAEAAPHAQHMPSHIFTRLGHWNHSIASNTTAAKLARANNEPDEQLHASDYLVYAYLQQGRDREARQVIDEMRTVSGYNTDRNVAAYALAASAARYAVERGDWKGATQLQPGSSRFGYADALTHFARALGAIRSGSPGAATADIDKLAQLRDALGAAGDTYWAEQVDIQWQAASAWLLHAQGKQAGALAAMRAAAAAEDRTEKGPVTPGPLIPARELYAALLLERGMPREALAAYEEAQAREPNRYHGVAGAAKAAEALGDTDKAIFYYTRLVALTAGSGSDRPELIAATQFLAKHSGRQNSLAPQDAEAPIRAIVADQMAAWNAGDAEGYARRVAPDVSFTNLFGMVMFGRAAFVERHNAILTTFYKATTKHHAIRRIHFVTPDVAIVDIDNEVRGVKAMPAGIVLPPDGVVKTQLMEVFAQRDGQWWIEAYHNVGIAPAK